MSMAANQIGIVKRELLVRLLDSWTPYASHRSRRAAFVQAYAGGGGGSADAALRVFVEFADLLRGRRMTVLTLAPQTEDLATLLGAAEAELPADVSVHLVPGGAARLPVAMKAAGAAGAPVLAFVDVSEGPAPDPTVLAAVATGRPAELLAVLGPQARHTWGDPAGEDPRTALNAAGFPLVTTVELVAGPDDDVELVLYATGSGKRLDAFKEAMWAVDEYAGVRYRDPADPAGHLLDISLNPHPGPLRRELLAWLAETGGCQIGGLRRFTAERTVYRSEDTIRVLDGLLSGGLVTREPTHGRLGGDVMIKLTG